jgi:hypothetical protein
MSTDYTNNGLTITFGEQVENHKGNQQIGSLANQGFTYAELQNVKTYLNTNGVTSELHNFGKFLPEQYGDFDTGVLVIRGGVGIFAESADSLWDENRKLSYDKHAFMYGGVKQKTRAT